MSRTLIIHLGYPKTGTTFLQKHIFPRIDSVRYLGRYEGLDDNLPHLKLLLTQLLFSTEQSFVHSMESLKQMILAEELNKYDQTDENLPLLISDEALMFRTIEPLEIRWHGKHGASLTRLVDRLKILAEELDYNIKVILSLREQAELIHSMYSERYSVFRKDKELDTIDNYLDVSLNKKYFDYGLCNLEYDKVVSDFIKAYGKDNILIVKYEDLINDANRFLGRFATFFNDEKLTSEGYLSLTQMKENVRTESDGSKNARVERSYTNNGFIKFLKFILPSYFIKSAFFKKLFHFLSHSGSNGHSKIILTDDHRSQIKAKYVESNRRLMAKFEEFSDYV